MAKFETKHGAPYTAYSLPQLVAEKSSNIMWSNTVKKRWGLHFHLWGFTNKSSSMYLHRQPLKHTIWLVNCRTQNLNGGKDGFCWSRSVVGTLFWFHFRICCVVFVLYNWIFTFVRGCKCGKREIGNQRLVPSKVAHAWRKKLYCSSQLCEASSCCLSLLYRSVNIKTTAVHEQSSWHILVFKKLQGVGLKLGSKECCRGGGCLLQGEN